jgi:hypothetical protein
LCLPLREPVCQVSEGGASFRLPHARREELNLLDRPVFVQREIFNAKAPERRVLAIAEHAGFGLLAADVYDLTYH